MYYGFEVLKNGTVDAIPGIFKSLNKTERISFFLVLYNSFVENSLKIPLNFAKNANSIEEVFKKRINFLLEQNRCNNKKATNFCVYSAKIIHLYKKNNLENLPFCINLPENLAAKLIYMIYKKETPGIKFDAKSLFSHYVFQKISLQNKARKIYLRDELIIINENGKEILGVLPYFKYMSNEKQFLANTEIKHAKAKIEALNLPAIYIVYPRNKDFKKHIEVKFSAFDEFASVKLVPYTISNKLIRRINVNSNSLRKFNGQHRRGC